MPVEKRGVVFRYFDKFICVVVALGVVLAVVYAVQRKAAAARQVDINQVSRDVDRIRERLRVTPPEVAVPDYLPEFQQAYTEPSAPGTVRDDLMWPPLPQQYAAFRVGPSREFTIEFEKPLVKGSVEVEARDGLLALVEHPVGNDYRKVKLRSGSLQVTDVNTPEAAKVRGRGPDVPHIYPIVIDGEVGKTAYQPVELAVADDLSLVLLEFKPDPNIKKEDVKVTQYEVWRRDWADPLGKFRKVGGLDLTGGRIVSFGGTATTQRGTATAQRTAPPPTGMSMPPAGAMDPSMTMDPSMMDPSMMMDPFGGLVGGRPGGMTGGSAGGTRRPSPTGGTRRQVEEESYQWQDNDVTSGERYSYKVRTVGSNTFPSEGEYTEPVVADVQPTIDFRFTGGSFDTVRFDVVQQTSAMAGRGTALEQFNVMRGGEIGGVVESVPGVVQSFLTGMTLVDQHRSVRREGAGVSSRILYADEEGNLHVRWQNEGK